MKRLFFATLLLLCTICSHSQHTVKLSIRSGTDSAGLSHATIIINSLKLSLEADSSGNILLSDLPAGIYRVLVSFAGFGEKQISLAVPQMATLEIFLEPEEEEEEEVVVSAIRLSRTIANTPTRVEVISGEELAEKANMKPGDIRMMLNESTGIMTQQTSATSFNAGIRIQGLDGRYTQILKDGYPLYSGFSGGLSLLQIPPLDLKQVEVIKGSASTLYGGGAIAGLVNLVSKTPGKERKIDLLANGTTGGGLDVSAFYSERYGKAGLTLFASRNSNKAFDPGNTGFTAIPKFIRYSFNPRVFLYTEKTTADIGLSYITEDRLGGSMNYIKGTGTGFFEKNNSDRISLQLGVSTRLKGGSTFQFKNSFSRFDRVVNIPGYVFDGLQQSSFSELTWNKNGKKADWVAGLNYLTENLDENPNNIDPERDYHFNTVGLFIQNAWSVSEKVVLEAGLRADYVNAFGFQLLPRISMMGRLSPFFTLRMGGGMGYKPPTIFTEEAERMQYRHILPVDVNNTINERSAGLSWDINFHRKFGELGFSFNQLFFYTRLNHPLVLVALANNQFQFANENGFLDTKGMETNLRLVYGNMKLFVGYTYTDANTHFNNEKKWMPLTARHRLNNVLMYEVEDKVKLGLEAYYFSPQKLSNGNQGRSYWITGFMAEKPWRKLSLFINFENFSNTRQSRFAPIYSGTPDNPQFQDIYAPVEGFVINGGVKVKL